MAPPRESANASDTLTCTAMWEGIEEDVEKKRHVKDPFREAFVALVATPFDAVCGETTSMRRQQQRIEEAMSDTDDDERASNNGDDGVERVDCSVLQQEISARSQQVHLRLEILRRQVQSLMEESGSVLDKVGRVVVKSEPHTKKKNATLQSKAAEDTAEDHSITDLETLLERVALYESGELTDSDLQKSWQRSKCKCTTHEIPGAADMLKSLRDALEIEYEEHRERGLLYFGPKIPQKNDEQDHEHRADQPRANDDMAQFLEGCRRSIKPFFLEDFVQLDQEHSQSDDASQEECISPQRIDEEEASPKPITEGEDVTMSEIDSSEDEYEKPQLHDVEPPAAPNERKDGEDRETNQATLISIDQLRSRREALRNKARQVTDRLLSSRKLQARTSRASGVSRASVKSTSAAKPTTLLADAKWWKNFARSIIDPTLDLFKLRDVVTSRNGDFIQTDEPTPVTEVTLNGLAKQETASEICAVNLGQGQGQGEARAGSKASSDEPSDQPHQIKRQSEVELAVRTKKQRVDNEPKPSRSLTLGKMVQLIRQNFTRIAQTSCVSYLSTIIRSGISSGKPQRCVPIGVHSAQQPLEVIRVGLTMLSVVSAFVALVFSASLTNTTPDPRKTSSDKVTSAAILSDSIRLVYNFNYGWLQAPLQVHLHAARDGRDVKIICQHE